MEELARVYAESLFGVAKEKGTLDTVRDQLGQFSDAVKEDRDLQVFFFSPSSALSTSICGSKGFTCSVRTRRMASEKRT